MPSRSLLRDGGGRIAPRQQPVIRPEAMQSW